MKNVLALLLAIGAAAIASVPLFVTTGLRRSIPQRWSRSRERSLTFQFVNPHVQVYFECKNEKGETEKWQGELTAPNKLIRAGWDKHTLNPGDSITVSGYAAVNGAHTIWIREMIGPAGEPLPLFEE